MENVEPTNETLAFYPPRIVAATEGVISEKVPKPPEVPVQGVPLSLFEEVRNAHGVLAGAVTLRIDSIPADADYPNDIDEVSWWLNGNRMEGVAINPANRDDVLFFNVFLDDLLDTVTNEILYKTRRPSGNETPSTALWVLCSKTLPGGNDVPGTGAHPGLQLSLPAELGSPALIGKEEVEAGVLATYTYSHMKAYDTITLDINGEQFTVKLDPDDVGESFSALIDRTMFEWVGSLENCPFRFRVRDQLGNFTHNHRWSGIIYANIDLERVFFPKPVLRERAEDTTDDPETVNLDLLEGKPLLVMIRADDSLYKIGDIVTAYYWLDDSTEKVTEPGEFPADEFGDLDKCIVYIPNDQLDSDARLQVRFKVERPKGTVIGTSRIAMAKVIGSAQPQLQPPKLLDPAENPIDVLKYDQGVTLLITFLDAAPGDHAQLVEDPPFAGSVPFPSVPFNASKTVDYQLPSEFLVMRRGSTRRFRWTLIRNSIPTGESSDLTLVIDAIAADDPRLPIPNIAGELGQQLNVAGLPDDARVLSEKIPLMQQGHPVWVDFEGVDAEGKSVTEEISSGELSELADRISLLAKVEWLKQLKDVTPLKINCSINLDNIKNKTTALPLPPRIYTLQTVEDIRPEITSLSGLPSNTPIPQDGITTEPAIRVFGTATTMQTVELFDFESSLGEATADSITGKWTKDVNVVAKPYSLTAKALYGSQLESQPPRKFTMSDSITITKFGNGSQFINGGTVDLGVATLTYIILVGNPAEAIGKEDLLSMQNGYVGSTGYGSHKVTLNFKGRFFNTIDIVMHSMIIDSQGGGGLVSGITGNINLLSSNGSIHTQQVNSQWGYPPNLIRLPNSFTSLEISQTAAAQQYWSVRHLLTKIVCSNS